MSKKTLAVVAILSFALGSTLTFSALRFDILSFDDVRNPSDSSRELHLGETAFVNPLLDCPDTPNGKSPVEALLQEKIQDLIAKGVKEGKVSTVSVYFRDLLNGPIININAEEYFIGASLMKVPVAIGIFQKVMKDPSLLERQLAYNAKTDFVPDVTQEQELRPLTNGEKYTVKHLLERMIQYSDNTSSAVLLNNFLDLDVVATLKQMGVPLKIQDNDAWLTVKNYASMFRILYNATYLDKKTSNDLLALLSGVTYDKALRAGIDANIAISHKFGEREFGTDNQLHDCGIVYYPTRPFLICVMTRGKDLQRLEQMIASIARATLESVKSQ